MKIFCIVCPKCFFFFSLFTIQLLLLQNYLFFVLETSSCYISVVLNIIFSSYNISQTTLLWLASTIYLFWCCIKRLISRALPGVFYSDSTVHNHFQNINFLLVLCTPASSHLMLYFKTPLTMQLFHISILLPSLRPLIKTFLGFDT